MNRGRTLATSVLSTLILAAAALPGWTQSTVAKDKDIGKEAPLLSGLGWNGSPVSLEAARGNTVILAFWNADVPC